MTKVKGKGGLVWADSILNYWMSPSHHISISPNPTAVRTELKARVANHEHNEQYCPEAERVMLTGEKKC
jgi:hypothetical protein